MEENLHGHPEKRADDRGENSGHDGQEEILAVSAHAVDRDIFAECFCHGRKFGK
jgi:hypothetical protein